MATRRVGFLGLGVMGKQMAKQLLRSNIEVVVWNRSMDKTNELVEDLGATAMGSPAEVVAASDVTHAMLSDPAASEAVVLGPDGVLAANRLVARHDENYMPKEAYEAIKAAGGKDAADAARYGGASHPKEIPLKTAN